MTSVWLNDRSRYKPGASYQCGKSWFVNVITDWKSKQFPYSPRQEALPRYEFFDSDESCLKLASTMASLVVTKKMC